MNYINKTDLTWLIFWNKQLSNWDRFVILCHPYLSSFFNTKQRNASQRWLKTGVGNNFSCGSSALPTSGNTAKQLKMGNRHIRTGGRAMCLGTYLFTGVCVRPCVNHRQWPFGLGLGFVYSFLDPVQRCLILV